MPIYQYRNPTTGEVIERIRPVQDRDRAPRGFARVTAPQRVAVVRGILDPETPDAAIPRALKQLEHTIDHRAIARGSGFSTRQLREIWNV